MTTRPTSQHVDHAIESMLLWQEEAKARNMTFYTNALVKNELTVVPSKEHTTRKANCDICYMPQKPGIRKFFYRENRETGYQSFWFHPCDACWTELMTSTPMHHLVLAQVPQPVTT